MYTLNICFIINSVFYFGSSYCNNTLNVNNKVCDVVLLFELRKIDTKAVNNRLV